MPAGSQITGEDGIINLKGAGGGADIGEVPCLENWTLNTSASLSERGGKCMKSNGDGGTGSTAGWTSDSVDSKSWTVNMEFYWQKDQLIPAAVQLSPLNVGQEMDVELFPNDNAVDDRVFSGTVKIESVDVSAEVNGDIKCSVSCKGQGALTEAAVV